MGKLTNRFELRLSDEHSRRLKVIMEVQNNTSKSHVIRGLIDQAYNEVS